MADERAGGQRTTLAETCLGWADRHPTTLQMRCLSAAWETR